MDTMTQPIHLVDGHMVRSQTTRVLHLGLLLLILHQLIGNQFMHRPFPGDPPSLIWDLHEYLGMVSLVVVGAFWVWTLVRRRETPIGRLLPWFSVERLRDVWDDTTAQLRRLLRLRAPDDEDGAMASAVHGLGLLVVTAMAGTGTIYFLTSGVFAHDVLTLHKLMSKLMYAYLFAHAGLAVLHHLLGSDILSRMFWGGRAGARRETSLS
jgi:cytochrome b561